MRDAHVGFGPPIPNIPYGDFTPLPFNELQLAQAWRVIGPSVDVNIRRNTPLWQVIVAAYLEGLGHGASIATPARLSSPNQSQGR